MTRRLRGRKLDSLAGAGESLPKIQVVRRAPPRLLDHRQMTGVRNDDHLGVRQELVQDSGCGDIVRAVLLAPYDQCRRWQTGYVRLHLVADILAVDALLQIEIANALLSQDIEQ